MDLKKGFVKVQPESLDDIWHLFNIISRGDGVYAKTTREVKIEGEGMRPAKGERISVSIGIIADDVSFDKSINRLRVKGVVVEAPEDLGIKGAHHTINVIIGNPVTITKAKWLEHHIDRLKTASEQKVAPILVVALDDGDCCIALLQHYGFDVKLEMKSKLPGKLEAEKRAEGMLSYFKSITESLDNLVKRTDGNIVIVGPGFVKEKFVGYLKEKTPDLTDKIIAVKSVSSAGVAGVHEALRSGILANVAKRIRAVEEAEKVEEVFARIGKGSKNVTYGVDDVEKAVSFGAVEMLLVADRFLREASGEEMIKLEEMIRQVEKMRGKVMIISTEQEAGEKILSLGGIAATLRFPIS
jgi:protein pelota